MARVVLERCYHPARPDRSATARWGQFNAGLEQALWDQGVWWVRSCVARDGSRSVCELEAVSAAVVAVACDAVNMPVESVWPAETWLTGDPTVLSGPLAPIVVEVTFDPPITRATCDANKKQAAGCLSELGVQSAFSLVSRDERRALCLFAATHAEAVR